MSDGESNWAKQLLTALGALVITSLVVGGVASLVALGAADVAGVAGDDSGQTATAEPSLYIPPRTSASGEPSTSTTPAGSATSQPSEPKSTKPAKPRRKPQQISLSASPNRVSEMERINLDGRYRGGNGATVQVQRLEGGRWVDFPTSAAVSGGSFSTYVLTGRTGKNRFRVIDESTGRKSAPVTVTVR